MTLGDIIKEYRQEHQMSMDTFSGRSGLSKAYISLLEKNKHPKTGKPIAPSIQSIKAAADGMNMDFNILFGMIDGDVSLLEQDIERPAALSPAAVLPSLVEDTLTVSGLEKEIIVEYRAADSIAKAMVLRALNLEEEREERDAG